MERVGRPTLHAAPRFWKGPARLEGGWIVLDARRKEAYDPFPQRELLLDFMTVRDPSQAAEFASEYGLLHRYDESDDEWREPADLWLHHAAGIANLLRIAGYLLEAAQGSESSRRLLLESLWPQIAEDLRQDGLTDEQKLCAFAVQIARDVSLRMEGSSRGIAATCSLLLGPEGRRGPIGAFMFSTVAPHLLTYLYAIAADVLVSEVPLRACVVCGRPFLLEDPRRVYCSDRCSMRARNQRRPSKARNG